MLVLVSILAMHVAAEFAAPTKPSGPAKRPMPRGWTKEEDPNDVEKENKALAKTIDTAGKNAAAASGSKKSRRVVTVQDEKAPVAVAVIDKTGDSPDSAAAAAQKKSFESEKNAPYHKRLFAPQPHVKRLRQKYPKHQFAEDTDEVKMDGTKKLKKQPHMKPFQPASLTEVEDEQMITADIQIDRPGDVDPETLRLEERVALLQVEDKIQAMADADEEAAEADQTKNGSHHPSEFVLL